MVKLSLPFLVNIKFAFEDETKLYIVSDFMQGTRWWYVLLFIYIMIYNQKIN